jgi:hypothetical protein
VGTPPPTFSQIWVAASEKPGAARGRGSCQYTSAKAADPEKQGLRYLWYRPCSAESILTLRPFRADGPEHLFRIGSIVGFPIRRSVQRSKERNEGCFLGGCEVKRAHL